ncbi:phosphatidylcholine and lysophosphatidylcholine phospholipase [Dinochytrium kinnereticum]|nr:phosphatidylcholine and lysophosphatidylcholine phospholipase [Dinochytrium kinnereticum]
MASEESAATLESPPAASNAPIPDASAIVVTASSIDDQVPTASMTSSRPVAPSSSLTSSSLSLREISASAKPTPTIASLVLNTLEPILANATALATSAVITAAAAAATVEAGGPNASDDPIHEPATAKTLTESLQLTGSITTFLYYVFMFIPYHTFEILRYTTTTLTLTLSLWSILITLLVVATLSYTLFRYQVLTRYSRLPKVTPPPHVSDKLGNVVGAPFDLHPDAALDDGYGRDDASAYPDEFMGAFLASIKVFGYLDRPSWLLFANLITEKAHYCFLKQTKKLKAGEILTRSESEDRDFCVLVEGMLRVYVKAQPALGGQDNELETFNSMNDDDEIAENDPTGKIWSGHHLLNEVRPGGAVSSLFSILSIFTEDLKVPTPQPEGHKGGSATSSQPPGERAKSNDSIGVPSQDESSFVIEDETTGLSLSDDASKAPNDVFSPEGETAPDLSKPILPEPEQQKRLLHSSIVVRAASDSTIAVIPAEAFRKLTEKFPNAAAHIAQVILTRFHRVTFLTLYRYLGLSKELLKIEKQVNEFAGYGLPTDFFKPGGLDRLKKRHTAQIDMNDVSMTDTDTLQSTSMSLNTNRVAGEARAARAKSPPRSPNSILKKKINSKSASKFKRSDDYYEADVDDSEKEQRQNHMHARGGLAREYANGAYQARQPQANMIDTDEDLQIKESILDCISAIIGMVPTVKPQTYKAPHRPSINLGDILLTNAQARKRAEFSRANSQFDSPSYLHRRSSIDSQDEYEIMSVTSSATGYSNASGSEAPAPAGAEIKIISLARGETLIREGEKSPGLWFCVDGILEASMRERTELFSASDILDDEREPRGGRRRGLFLIKPGGLAGYLAAMTGHVSFVTIRAKTDAQVGFLPKASLDRYIERYPNVLLTLSKRLITQLSPLVINIDVALEWGQVNAGQVLYRQQDISDSIYLVLNGRLRAIAEHKVKGSETTSFEIFGEYGKGESVGELEVLTGIRRPSTVHAIRDTEIALMPKTLFNALAIRHPEITIQISRIIASRSRRGGPGSFPLARSIDSPLSGALGGGVGVDSGKNNVNLKTVAVIPVTSAVPITEFADKLRDALELNGASVALLNTATVIGKLGRHVFSRIGRLKLMSWLAEQEENFRMLVYVADGGANAPWTQRCIRQADCILLVGLGDEEPTIGEYERLLISMKTTARKELVLLHNERFCLPGSTAAWLKNRLWVHAHHHVQMSLAAPKMLTDANRMKTLTNLKNHFQRYYTRASTGLHGQKTKSPNIHTGLRSDFSRLARRLLSKSIGLVLGGGGARGIAHIGIIKSFEEAGIPIDMVGGTSIGSFVSGLYSRESDHVSVMARAKNFSSKIVSVWRQLVDLTYPATSLFTGHEFNRAIWKCFYDTQIEDCWLSYFAVTTNITHSRMEIHRSGYIWRYVRASMSLSGYFPPLCDDGKMLLDGGYLNNLPADIMRGLGAEVIIAVDVGLADDTSPVTYGDSLSGWWVFFSKWNPFGKDVYGKIPPMADIQSRLAYVGSVKQLEDAKAMEGCLYLQPPVAAFSTLQFESFKDIFDVGYKYGKDIVRKWEKDGTLARKFGVLQERSDERRGNGRRASI